MLLDLDLVKELHVAVAVARITKLLQVVERGATICVERVAIHKLLSALLAPVSPKGTIKLLEYKV